MPHLLALYLIAFVLMLALVILAINGRLVNWFYFLCVVLDALLDVACQIWISVGNLFNRPAKGIELDEHENFWS